MHAVAVASRSLPPVEAENLRAHLRALLAARDWTQRDAARAVGVSQQALSSLLRGASAASFGLARAVARELGVEVGALLSSPPGKMNDRYPNRAATLAFLADEVPPAIRARVLDLDVGPSDQPRAWWAQRVLIERQLAALAEPDHSPSTGIRQRA